MAVKTLKETPGYRENPVTESPADAAPVQDSIIDVSPPTPSAGGSFVQIQQESGTPDTPNSQASGPEAIDTSSFQSLGEALGELQQPTNNEGNADQGTPDKESTVGSLQNRQRTILSALAPTDYGSITQLPPPIKRSPEPVVGQPNSRGYTPVLPKLVTPSSGTVPPDSTSLGEFQLTDLSPTVGTNWNFGQMESPNALVVHHTAGGGNREGVIQTFKDRNFPAHFIIERDGTIVQVLGLNQKGQHTRPAEDGSGITNSNSWGVEIIARDDSDVRPVQVEAAKQLVQFLETKGLDPNRVVGHGQINSHKQATEGQTVIQALMGGHSHG